MDGWMDGWIQRQDYCFEKEIGINLATFKTLGCYLLSLSLYTSIYFIYSRMVKLFSRDSKMWRLS